MVAVEAEIWSTPPKCRPTWTLCCRLLLVCNSVVLFGLAALALYAYPRIDTLETQLAIEKGQLLRLQNEIRTEQQVQIQDLHEQVQEEHDLTFYTLAGIFTLLTCLISMFHMSTHLRHMKEPIIQRKIVAILWMSPIYSLTSFLSLLYPATEGYCAIIKDFYESYCIYTFLSFLIAVLGRGNRDQAIKVLAKRADHLDSPMRCLRRWYDPLPEVSDEAKANAVITECQILAMQFVFIRPLTTVMYVIYNAIKATEDKENAASNIDVANATISLVSNITRWLQDNDGSRNNVEDYYNGTSSDSLLAETFVPSPSPSPLGEVSTVLLNITNATIIPNIFEDTDIKEATINYFTSFSFALTMLVNVSVFFAFTGLLKFYHAVRDDLQWCRPFPKFLTIKGVVFLTFWQGLCILIFVNIENDGTDDEDPWDKAHRYQNILICMEMLLFSISHWCVFPAEEWEKDYQPPQKVNKAGIGLHDFVSDVGYIVQSGQRTRRRRKTKKERHRAQSGLYHRPAARAVGTMASDGSYSDDDRYDEESDNVEGEIVEEANIGPKALSVDSLFDDSSSQADDEII